MKKKLISIIINCFNGEKYLQQTLNSILNQDYKNFEVVFVDNCSTDSSAKIFKKIKDKRLKYFRTKKKLKLYDSRNFALNKVKGDYIAFLDADDWWDKNFLKSRLKFFRSNKTYGYSFSNCLHYYENRNVYKPFYNKKLPSGNILDDLLKYYFVKLSTIIIKKKLLFNQKFDPSFNIIGDYDFIIKISKNFKGMSFQDTLVNIRIHKDNFTHNNRKMFYQEFKRWIKNQDFENFYFKKNKNFLLQKLEYLRLIYLIFENKNFSLIKDIIKYPILFYKLKLIIIFFIPNSLVKLLKNFF